MNVLNDCQTRLAAAPSDHQLVEESKRGNEQAMTELIRRHYTMSLRVARSILRNHHDSEDAVQTAYCRAFQHLNDFREEARFSTWITSIVVNQSLMHLRRQRRATVLSLEDPIGSPIRYFTSREPTPEEVTARGEIASAVSRALARLPNGLRLAYTMHVISGLPLNEVASQMGLSISATKSRIFRARCRLESRLYVSFGPAQQVGAN